MNDLICCFTGRRELSELDKTKIKDNLKIEIEKLIKQGYTTFLAGGALGFDTLCALEIINLKSVYHNIKLHIVLPHPDYMKNWKIEDISQYNKIQKHCNKLIYTSENKRRGCNHIRNRYLVDNSSACIAYNNSTTGGTAYTVAYALKKSLNVINIADL